MTHSTHSLLPTIHFSQQSGQRVPLCVQSGQRVPLCVQSGQRMPLCVQSGQRMPLYFRGIDAQKMCGTGIISCPKTGNGNGISGAAIK